MKKRAYAALFLFLLFWGCAPLALAQNVTGGVFAYQDGALSGRWGLLDAQGKIVEAPIWEEEPRIDREWRVVYGVKDGRCGMQDFEGTVLFPFDYDDLYRMDDLVLASKGGVVGLFERDGTVALPFEWGYTGARPDTVQEGLFFVRTQESLCGIVDAQNNVVVAPQWKAIFERRDAATGILYFCVRDAQGKYGMVDWQGAVLVAPEYEEAFAFYDGIAPVQKKDKAGFIDTTGAVKIPFDFAQARSFDEGGLALVKSAKGRYGVIDRAGNYVLQPTFKKVAYETGGLVPAQDASGKWGYINEQYEYVIPPKWDGEAQLFNGAYAIVCHKGKWGLIDRTGKEVMTPQWYKLYPCGEGLYTFKRSDALRFGVIRADGTVVLADEWHSINGVHGGEELLLVGKWKERHYYTRDGELVFSWTASENAPGV